MTQARHPFSHIYSHLPRYLIKPSPRQSLTRWQHGYQGPRGRRSVWCSAWRKHRITLCESKELTLNPCLTVPPCEFRHEVRGIRLSGGNKAVGAGGWICGLKGRSGRIKIDMRALCVANMNWLIRSTSLDRSPLCACGMIVCVCIPGSVYTSKLLIDGEG